MTPVPSSRRASSLANSTLDSLDTAYSRMPVELWVGRFIASQSMFFAL